VSSIISPAEGRRRALPHSASASLLQVRRVTEPPHFADFTRPWAQKKEKQTCTESLRARWAYAREHLAKEKILMASYWRMILIGAIFQYVHSVATNVAYYMHVPREPLADLGFSLIPALSRETQIVSEYLFFALVGLTVGFAVSPFFSPGDRLLPLTKRRFTTVMLARFLGVCVLAQTLRIMTFLVTTLPGPNYHCRPDAPDYNPPRGLYDIFTRHNPFTHCGDLVFSSHTIFVTLCALTWHKYAKIGTLEKIVMWCLVIFFGSLVVAARKHYSLDVVVALYTVPLLWIAYDRFIPDKLPPELLSNDELFDEMEQECSVVGGPDSIAQDVV